MVKLRHSYDSDVYISGLFESDFGERTDSLQREYDEVKAKVLKESKEEEVDNLSKILFHSNSEFPSDFKNILEGHRKVHERGSQLKPDSLDSSQRPILSSLQELYHGMPLEDTAAAGGSSSGTQTSPTKKKKKSISKSAKGRLKEKAWNAKIENLSPTKGTKGKKRNLSEVPSEDEEEEEEVEKEIIYKRSAMLQKKTERAPRKNVSVGLRYIAPVVASPP